LSSRFTIGVDSVGWGQRGAGAGTWADSGWTTWFPAYGALNTSAGVAIPRIKIPISPGVTYTLISEFGDTRHGRLYVDSLGHFQFTVNAKWDQATSLWSHDNGANYASRLKFLSGTYYLTRHNNNGGPTWTDGQWGLGSIFSLNGDLRVDFTPPTYDTAQKYSLTPKNLLRSHGRCRSNGDGTSDMDTSFEEGYNTDPQDTHAAYNYLIDFPAGGEMADGNYTILVWAAAAPSGLANDVLGFDVEGVQACYNASSTGTFSIFFINTATGNVIDPGASGNDIRCYYMIAGS
jgi:hypothetical protein